MNINSNTKWGLFYSISGITTILLMVLFLFDVICWIIIGSYPNSAQSWYELISEKRSIGLLLLSFPTLFGTILYLPTLVSLNNILKKVNVSLSSLAAIIAIVGITLIILSHPGYSLLLLSNQYAVAEIEAQKTSLIIAGDTIIINSSSWRMIGGFLAEGAFLVFSILMLKSKIFSKWLGILGIIGHGLDFIRIGMLLILIPESKGAILLIIGGLPQLLWLIFVGIKFVQISKTQELLF